MEEQGKKNLPNEGQAEEKENVSAQTAAPNGEVVSGINPPSGRQDTGQSYGYPQTPNAYGAAPRVPQYGYNPAVPGAAYPQTPYQAGYPQYPQQSNPQYPQYQQQNYPQYPQATQEYQAELNSNNTYSTFQ